MAYVNNGPVRIWWEEVGQGEPVLLVMGFSFPGEMWHRVWPALTDRYRVIRLDNRGVGKSDAPKGPYSIGDMAKDALAVMNAAGVDKAHVYGASMGGGIVQELALQHPDRVASLVLGCTAAPPTPTGPLPNVPFIMRIAPIKLIFRLRGRRSYGDDMPEAAIKEDRAVLLKTRITNRGLIGQTQAIAAYSSQDRVGQLKMPVLVLHGDKDQTVPVEKGRELASLIPGAQLEIIEGAGHNYITTVDCRANEVLKEFWQRQPAI